LIVTAAAVLGACTHAAPPEPIIRTVEVKVPVPTSCVPKKLGDPPEYVDSDAALRAAAGPEDRYQLVYAGRKQRIARSAEVEPVIKTCRD
jgi:hypothetical protein